MNKILISGVLGGIVIFLLGWLFYGMLFMDMMASYSGTATGVSKDPMELGYIFFGNVITGILYAWIFSKWTGAIDMMKGLQLGFIFGLLSSAGSDLVTYGTTNLAMMNGILLDVVLMGVMGAAAGAVIALTMKKV